MTTTLKDAYTAAELAAMRVQGLPTSERRMRDWLVRQGVKTRQLFGRGGNGGKCLEFPLAALPSEIQIAIVGEKAVKVRKAPSVQAAPRIWSDDEIAARAEWFDRRPQSIKDRAIEAQRAVIAWNEAVESGVSREVATKAVCERFGIARATLRRWRKDVKAIPRDAWLFFLAPGYAGRTKWADLSAEAWEALKADYLRPERPAASTCIQRLRDNAKAEWVIPSNRTLLRRLNAISRPVQTLARQGEKALSALYPSQQRDKTALRALSIVNADGYLHNFWIDFLDGEVRRGKLWVWQDVKSSKILNWRLAKTEHTEVIQLSFGDLVEQWGIPDVVLLDNTLAAANKTMSGGIRHRFRFKVRDEEPDGVFKLLGVRVIWATPGHGQAKPVERVFGIGGLGEYIDKAPEFAGAWTGGSPVDKPEYDGKTRAIPVNEVEAVIAREIAAFNARTGRRGAAHRGRSFDEVFQESYEATPVRRATEAQRRLWLLSTEPVRASSRNGEIVLDAGRAVGMANRYWANELADYAGRMVVARFDPQRLHEGVHVYTVDGRYVCFAPCIEAKGFNDQGAAREHNRARRLHNKGVKLQLDAERRMDALEVAKTYAAAGPTTIPAPKVARGAVVRGEFRDPLERPAPAATPDTPEEAAERAALAIDMQRQNVVALRDEQDEWATYRRWLAIGRRIEAGADVAEGERAWHASYGASSECRTLTLMAEDFPEKVRDVA